MLKIGFSAKLSLSLSLKIKHSPISTITSCLLISLLSRTIFNGLVGRDFLSSYSCYSYNLIASKKTNLNQENSPFTSPFRSLLSARCSQLKVSCGCDFGCAPFSSPEPVVSWSRGPSGSGDENGNGCALAVHRSCSAHVFPAQGSHLNDRPTIPI